MSLIRNSNREILINCNEILACSVYNFLLDLLHLCCLAFDDHLFTYLNCIGGRFCSNGRFDHINRLMKKTFGVQVSWCFSPAVHSFHQTWQKVGESPLMSEIFYVNWTFDIEGLGLNFSSDVKSVEVVFWEIWWRHMVPGPLGSLEVSVVSKRNSHWCLEFFCSFPWIDNWKTNCTGTFYVMHNNDNWQEIK